MIANLFHSRFSKNLAILSHDTQLTYSQLDQKVSKLASLLKRNNIKKGSIETIAQPISTDYVITLLALWRIGAVACPLNTCMPQAVLCEISKCIKKKPIPVSRLQAMTISAPATIIFTSGSSGKPKEVLHTIGNHYYSALGSNDNIPINPNDRWLLSLPLYHVSGLSIIWRCLIAGATIIIPPKNQTIEDSVQAYGITHLSLVPTQLQRLIIKKQNLKKLKTIKAILLGGGPIPEGLIENTKTLNLPVYSTYGLTEMASQVATSKAPDDKLFILKYRNLKINKNNEILVSGKTLFKGYWHNGTIKNTLDKNGWFHTGDIGSFNKKTGLRILGRKDNMFISGGENIYPEEIEKAILNTGLVENVIVFPYKNAEFGFCPIALIDPYIIDTRPLVNALIQTLPSYKIPKKFYPFPKKRATKGLKPDRKWLLATMKD